MKRVAYLTLADPYCPEYQHFDYFAAGAAANGYAAVRCFNAADVQAAAPEFVFVMHPALPKASPYPHYGHVQYPVELINTKQEMRVGVLSWDGYVTTAPACRVWLADLLQKMPEKKISQVGHYYLAGHTQEFVENYQPQKLVYAGTGWDQRGLDLCRLLQEKLGDAFVIYGNPKFWQQHNFSAYQGFLDSPSLLVAYRQGVCLSISNPSYLAQDIMTTRMHEASSLGVATIAPRTPQTMLMYGDTLGYYNGAASPAQQAAEICAAYAQIKQSGWAEQRRRAYEIFKQTYAQDVMFKHLLNYHHYCLAYGPAAAKLTSAPMAAKAFF